ncbi:DUF4234 domain-containing protein [bacterium SCSIO 12696]|nr:DUF4234 domain-containing protein [bacterium SCSIO 12696]
MEHTTANPYKTPGSEVLNTNAKAGAMNFKRISAWGVFGLGIITLGIYYIYWMYNRAQVINQFHGEKISAGLLNGFVAIVIATFLSGFITEFVDESGLILEAILNLAYFVLWLLVIFGIRSRLENILARKLNGIMTFFFGGLYLQYKINEAIDESIQE